MKRQSHHLGSTDTDAEIDVDRLLQDNFTEAEIFAWLVGESRKEVWEMVKSEFESEIEELIEEAKEE